MQITLEKFVRLNAWQKMSLWKLFQIDCKFHVVSSFERNSSEIHCTLKIEDNMT